MAAEGKKELRSHVSQLEKTTIHLTAERDEALKRADVLRSENGKLRSEMEQLLHRLLLHENHIPLPSLQKNERKQEEKAKKKRGAP